MMKMNQIKTPNKIQFRTLNGVFLLNKGLGDSSNRALQQVRRLFRAAKAGHTGSLDPLATGVLPICFGDATKFSSYLLDAEKTYKVTAKLGEITSTSDCEGEIIATHPVPLFTHDVILDAISKFMGVTKQTPSMYSALKHNGQPLYKLARQGISIEREAREIHIKKFDLLEQTADTLSFEVQCSKGTYIRNLIEDLGNVLGCGAHVAKLERTQAGCFTLENSHKYADIIDYSEQDLQQLLLPVECLLDKLPRIVLGKSDTEYVRNGRRIAAPNGVQTGAYILVNDTEKFLGIGLVESDGSLLPNRMISSVIAEN